MRAKRSRVRETGTAEDAPFVPDWDLLLQRMARPSPSELALIAAALWELTGGGAPRNDGWSRAAIQEAVGRRL